MKNNSNAMINSIKKKQFLEMAGLMMQWLKRAFKEVNEEKEKLNNKGKTDERTK